MRHKYFESLSVFDYMYFDVLQPHEHKPRTAQVGAPLKVQKEQRVLKMRRTLLRKISSILQC